MKKLFFRFLPIILLLALSFWAGKGLFKYKAFSTHDGLHHTARAYDVVKTFSEGHFPLRWAGTLNYGCGVPIYNFFYPLIYYSVIGINALVNSPLESLRLIDFATFFIGTIFFYLWIKSEIKDRWASLASSILYLYAPYRFSLVFVRGSPEFMSYAILPIVLYLYSLIFQQKNWKKFVLLSFLAALAGGFLTISHNFTAMFLMPIILLYIIIKYLKSRGAKLTHLGGVRLGLIIFAYLSAFGFGAFFIFPAILEEKFTQLGTPRFLYKDHFPALWQLVRSKWDYFYSAIGTELDGMSFMLGYAQWAVLGVGVIWVVWEIWSIWRNRKDERIREKVTQHVFVFIFLILSLGSIYLMLDISIPVWEKFPLLQKIQFPWRLLGIAIFTISALYAFLLKRVKNKIFYWILVIGISLLAFVGNRNHLLSMPIVDHEVKLFDNFEKDHYHRFTTTTFDNDILPPSATGTCWYDTPIMSGDKDDKIPYTLVSRNSTNGVVKFNMPENFSDNHLKLALSYYPGFSISLNGDEVDYSDCEGRACIDSKGAQVGPNMVSWKIVQTPIQSLFNKVSLGFLMIWGVGLLIIFIGYKPKVRHIVLVLIFASFFFFRFYNLEKRIGFGWDQERDANAVADILSGDIKLIGPRVLGDLGFFLPPYFFYILTPFYKVFAGSPYSTIAFLVFYNLAFFGISWLLLKRLFNAKTAFVFLALWAINPFTLSIDTVAWNPVSIPLFVILLICLISLAKMQSKKMFFGLGILFGLGVSWHIQFLLMAPILLPILLKDRKAVYTKSLYLALGFLTMLLPLLVFDLKNNFLNIRLLGEFFSKGRGGNILAFIPVWDNVVARFIGIPNFTLVSGIFYIVVLVILFIKRHEVIWRGLFYTWLIFPIFFALYGRRPSEYYFNYLIVVGILAISDVLANLKRHLIILGCAVFLLWSIKSAEQLREASFGLQKKDEIVRFVGDLTKDSSAFNISFSLGDEGDVGFRYLLKWRGVNYTGDPKDPLIQLTAPAPTNSNFVINGVGILVPQDWTNRN